MLHEEKQERQDKCHNAEKLQRDPQLVTLRPEGIAQQAERLHIAEHPQQPEHPQHLQRRVWHGEQQRKVEAVGRHNVDETIERQAIPHTAPEALVLRVQQIGTPDAQRHLDGEDRRGEDVDGAKPSAVAKADAVEGGKEHLDGTDDDQTDDSPIHLVLPLPRLQSVVEDAVQLLLYR